MEVGSVEVTNSCFYAEGRAARQVKEQQPFHLRDMCAYVHALCCLCSQY